MHLAPLIQDLAIILGLAAFASFIFRRLKQPVVLGYILAGLIVSPHTPGIQILDVASVKVWAELGVIFLMFSLGLEFSFRRLMQIGPAASIIGLTEITAMILLGYTVANLMGWDHMNGLFLAGMIAVSSTTIIIKSFDELKMRGRRFSDIVLGILIIEDIAAILILVILSSFVGGGEVGPFFIFSALAKLVLVVSSWFFIGMVIVPKILKSIVRYGGNEMMTLAAVALCLGLVALAAWFEYSVALGAFIMGSILAETRDGQKIEHLVFPLKDLFGAVFFVSVGMLIDPNIILTEWRLVLVISGLIIGGKLIAVSCGALLAGQSRKNVLGISFSMAQVGEFSFIIATLGLSRGVLRREMYPVIVFASILTTFLTPYLMRAADPVAVYLDRCLPRKVINFIDEYGAWMERRLTTPSGKKIIYNSLMRWLASVVVMTAIFVLVTWLVLPNLERLLPHAPQTSIWIAWGIAVLVSSPFVAALLMGNAWVGGITAILLIGVLSQQFMSAYEAFGLTIAMVLIIGFFLRQRIIHQFHWFEKQFLAGFSASNLHGLKSSHLEQGLSPWGAQLTEVQVSYGSSVGGKTLEELGLRESYGINVICIKRGDQVIAPPVPKDRIFPHDTLLVFGDEVGITRFLQEHVAKLPVDFEAQADMESFQIYVLNIEPNHFLCGRSIRESRLREDFNCIVVGLEHGGHRMQNPHSDTKISAGDAVWIVGEKRQIDRILQWTMLNLD